jgi:AraC-like DNA-binding protein
MPRIITEITPLSKTDCFYLAARDKKMFDYPLHRHEEYELNFVSHCTGARRVVGDSMEELGAYDLVLIGGGLPHCWEQYHCTSESIHEVTIQFSSDLLSPQLMMKTQLDSIREMFERARTGLAFSMPTILSLYSKLEELTQAQPGFLRLLKLFEILYLLSRSSEDSHTLSSSSFAEVKSSTDSRRVRKVEDEIEQNYSRQIYLKDLADMVGMTPTAFSRFFKVRTGRTLSDYIIDIRMGHAARMLVNTTMTMSEICYECGFNNISNFNRIFKKRKGCCPKEFRDSYMKAKLII